MMALHMDRGAFKGQPLTGTPQAQLFSGFSNWTPETRPGKATFTAYSCALCSSTEGFYPKM
jgi:hypothetical protein